MLKISTGGYKIVHKRDIDEIYVNNYNKEWIKSWNANMDIQLGKGSKIKLIIFAEFSAKGYPPSPLRGK